ncbi:hypothetical protein DM992_28415 [Burkholderia sp. JP2-270]|nr:hypothetical protein DM992_28415 [Burkholderia sp. JP2-270]
MGHPIARLAIAGQQENRLHAIESMRVTSVRCGKPVFRGFRAGCARLGRPHRYFACEFLYRKAAATETRSDRRYNGSRAGRDRVSAVAEP